jgi:hypothetical protein
MPRVVPSQVLQIIDAFPSYETLNVDFVNLRNIGNANLAGILDLVDQVPDELLTMNGEAYASLVMSKCIIRDCLQEWNADRTANVTPRGYPVRKSRDPIANIRAALSACPDAAPATTTSELKFVTDLGLRDNLRTDIGEVTRSLADGEWKGATILAGSTIEALLLWELQNRSAGRVKGAVSAVQAKEPKFKPDSNLERWNLYEFIEVAAQIGVLEKETAIEATLAKDYRNLIHPGKAQRLGQKCDRGTAHASYAALDHVVRDLS